jgi:putative SOS response-associated peptidase YedK
MCARYRLKLALRFITDRLGLTVEEFEEFTERPRLNIRISERVPIIKSIAGRPTLALVEWGFLAPWDQSKRIFNAAAETVAVKSTFRDSFRMRRCLIPADGFYEWPGKRQTLIHFADDRPFCFAGLWVDNTMTMLTCAPNEFMQPIHHRMPVILRDEECATWLDPHLPEDVLHAVLSTRAWEGSQATAISERLFQGPSLFPD